jgi:hypothetical protein
VVPGSSAALQGDELDNRLRGFSSWIEGEASVVISELTRLMHHTVATDKSLDANTVKETVAVACSARPPFQGKPRGLLLDVDRSGRLT